MIKKVASLGFVVVAPDTGNCNFHQDDIIQGIDWVKSNASLHEALQHVDWRRAGIFGHSFGSAHAMEGVAKVLRESPEEYPHLKALYASHGFSMHIAQYITVPTLFTNERGPRGRKGRASFSNSPARNKVMFHIEGAGHMEPAQGGRETPFAAHFLGCHVADLQSSCGHIYGENADLCTTYTMSQCEVVENGGESSTPGQVEYSRSRQLASGAASPPSSLSDQFDAGGTKAAQGR